MHLVGPIDVRAVLDSLVGADPLVVDNDELRALVASASQVRGWLDRSRSSAFDDHDNSPTTVDGDAPDVDARKARATARTGKPPESNAGPTSLTSFGGAAGRRRLRLDRRRPTRPAPGRRRRRRLVRAGVPRGPHLQWSSRRDGRRHATSRRRRPRRVRRTSIHSARRGACRACRRVRPDAVAQLARRLVAARASVRRRRTRPATANSIVKRWVDKITGMCHHTSRTRPGA